MLAAEGFGLNGRLCKSGFKKSGIKKAPVCGLHEAVEQALVEARSMTNEVSVRGSAVRTRGSAPHTKKDSIGACVLRMGSWRHVV